MELPITYTFDYPTDGNTMPRTYIRFDDMFKNLPPFVPFAEVDPFPSWVQMSIGQKKSFRPLNSLLMRLSQECARGQERDYARDLMSSFKSLRNSDRSTYILGIGGSGTKAPPRGISLLFPVAC